MLKAQLVKKEESTKSESRMMICKILMESKREEQLK